MQSGWAINAFTELFHPQESVWQLEHIYFWNTSTMFSVNTHVKDIIFIIADTTVVPYTATLLWNTALAKSNFPSFKAWKMSLLKI